MFHLTAKNYRAAAALSKTLMACTAKLRRQARLRLQQRRRVACKMRIKDQIAKSVITTYLGPDAGLTGLLSRGPCATV